MCVCIYIYVYIHIHAYIHTDIYIYIFFFLNKFCVYIYIYIHKICLKKNECCLILYICDVVPNLYEVVNVYFSAVCLAVKVKIKLTVRVYLFTFSMVAGFYDSGTYKNLLKNRKSSAKRHNKITSLVSETTRVCVNDIFILCELLFSCKCKKKSSWFLFSNVFRLLMCFI